MNQVSQLLFLQLRPILSSHLVLVPNVCRPFSPCTTTILKHNDQNHESRDSTQSVIRYFVIFQDHFIIDKREQNTPFSILYAIDQWQRLQHANLRC